MTDRLSVRFVGGVLLVRADGAVLLQHRDNVPSIPHPDEWAIPGGAAEGDEAPRQTAARELLEETGYHASDLRHLDSSRYERRGWLIEANLFWAPYDGLQEIHCYEGQEMRWIPAGDTGGLALIPDHREALRGLAAALAAEGAR